MVVSTSNCHIHFFHSEEKHFKEAPVATETSSILDVEEKQIHSDEPICDSEYDGMFLSPGFETADSN